MVFSITSKLPRKIYSSWWLKSILIAAASYLLLYFPGYWLLKGIVIRIFLLFCFGKKYSRTLVIQIFPKQFQLVQSPPVLTSLQTCWRTFSGWGSQPSIQSMAGVQSWANTILTWTAQLYRGTDSCSTRIPASPHCNPARQAGAHCIHSGAPQGYHYSWYSLLCLYKSWTAVSSIRNYLIPIWPKCKSLQLIMKQIETKPKWWLVWWSEKLRFSLMIPMQWRIVENDGRCGQLRPYDTII